MRSCSTATSSGRGPIGRPCLLGYIGKCVAPCVGNVTAEEHREIVDDFCDFTVSGRPGTAPGKMRRPSPTAR